MPMEFRIFRHKPLNIRRTLVSCDVGRTSAFRLRRLNRKLHVYDLTVLRQLTGTRLGTGHAKSKLLGDNVDVTLFRKLVVFKMSAHATEHGQ
jgi:hypothetical protein